MISGGAVLRSMSFTRQDMTTVSPSLAYLSLVLAGLILRVEKLEGLKRQTGVCGCLCCRLDRLDSRGTERWTQTPFREQLPT